MSTKSNIIKKQMLEALEASLGVVSTAAKEVGISRKTHYEWLINDPEYKAAVDDLENVALDFAESKLHQSINNGSDAATIFYLKTKGKKRGYIEKNEVEVSGGLETTVDLSKLPTPILEQLIKGE